MSVISTPTGYTMRLDANASGFAFSGLQRLPIDNEAKYIVWVSGSLYQTFNSARGIVEYSGTSAFDAIKTAQSGAFVPGQVGEVNNPFSGSSEIFIKDGLYTLGSDFTGFNITKMTHIKMARQAVLLVPTSYSGYVFGLRGRPRQVHIEGGVIAESGATVDLYNSGRQYTGFYLYASGAANGIAWNTIQGVMIHNPKYGFHFHNATQGWTNSNIFQDCHVIYPITGILFTAESGAVASQGVNSNTFIHVSVQAASGVTYHGIDATSGRSSRVSWIDCTMWDTGFTSGASSAVFGDNMMNQYIINGAVTHDSFVATGSGVVVLDAYSPTQLDKNLSVGGTTYTKSISNSGLSAAGGQGTLIFDNQGSGQAMTIYLEGVSGINNSSISWWDSVADTERLLIQKTTMNNFRSSRQSTSGVVRPTVFQMHDAVATTTIEGLRIDESGNTEFNRSGGTVQFKSGNTSLTRTETASMSGAFSPLGFITARLGTSSIKIPYFAT